MQHPKYSKDSLVSEEITYDLLDFLNKLEGLHKDLFVKELEGV